MYLSFNNFFCNIIRQILNLAFLLNSLLFSIDRSFIIHAQTHVDGQILKHTKCYFNFKVNTVFYLGCIHEAGHI